MDHTVRPSARLGRLLLAVALCLVLVPVVPAGASVPRTLYVDPANGSDTNDGLTPGTAFEHISDAVNVTNDGDTIVLAPGVYDDESFPVDVHRGLTITSSGETEETIIDAGGDAQVMYVNSGSAPVVLDGITFTGGHFGMGGGAIAVFNTDLEINDCVFVDNLADRGSGIYANSSSLTVQDCWFDSNGEETTVPVVAQIILPPEEDIQCQEGGAIYATSGMLEVFDSMFTDNGAFYAAPGIFLGGMEALVQDSEFDGNQVTMWFSPEPPLDPEAAGVAGSFADAAARLESGDVSAQQIGSDGGAIMAVESWLGVLGSTFSNNLAFNGAGIAAIYSSVRAEECTFADNLTYTGAVSTSD